MSASVAYRHATWKGHRDTTPGPVRELAVRNHYCGDTGDRRETTELASPNIRSLPPDTAK